ncbi:hypothetical protein EI42_02397 [Thermosporothrix hazakensis]|jgi:hypothetical protein|uniref:Uncharacterized protein n=2 Tax=Thermosporothrix TaxID=768650 RepID=A0A326U8Z3_THEHA|nr:FDLD family class I lanthipeptide [Thermosporothrix hazakensis]PZW31300.1 hypothetical protein EI42_02397 [Thermosporothrix hazakensis]BBH86465.1 hypothetical protein KTC_12160 [Thermosporothrix sp. COM3]GCE50788.1 hypothetical protein KTH_56570 [Thermosporothrix hazakensis]
MEQALIELRHDATFEDEFELDIRVSTPSSNAQPSALATINTCYESCAITCFCLDEQE